MDETFGERLERLRIAAGLSRRGLAKKAGLGETFVRDTVLLGTTPGIERVQKLAVALGVTVAELTDGVSELSTDEMEVIRLLRRMTPRDRMAARTLIQQLGGAAPPGTESDPQG